jgi:hypothetical protein
LATDVATGGGVKALWRDHNNALAATSATASSTIHRQCHWWRDSRLSASITGSVMSQMLLAWDDVHWRAFESQWPQMVQSAAKIVVADWMASGWLVTTPNSWFVVNADYVRFSSKIIVTASAMAIILMWVE